LTVNRNTGLMPPSTSSACRDAQIAQSVEQRIENPRVRGSIPRLGTIILKPRIYTGFFYVCKKVRESVFLSLSHTIILKPRIYTGFFYTCKKHQGICIPEFKSHHYSKTSYLYGVFLYL
jgi:hypothetical protein